MTPFEQQLLPPTWKNPIVNVSQSSKAKDTIYGIGKMINHKTLAKSVFLKHGSENLIELNNNEITIYLTCYVFLYFFSFLIFRLPTSMFLITNRYLSQSLGCHYPD